ncbi:unnamed protein product [Vitrella brassicaformis CCMP3155]|uniref:Uncharacterized protein n=2 Tax=Vitrella brassicaformis TaxID=1169539 RepID=A0A0G4ELE9_VITBC|nr:unnamed protein product [Vitrella brassicaformis CCMP3155]|eukprot:CEL98001.1 unnamed protein product [Vitrella brassicaformis CCMP3155]
MADVLFPMRMEAQRAAELRQPGEPFTVTLSSSGAPAYDLSATKQLAFGLADGSLAPDAAARLLTQHRADPSGLYYKESRRRSESYWSSLLHLAAEKCSGAEGAAILTHLLSSPFCPDVNQTTPFAEDCLRIPWESHDEAPLDALLDRLPRATDSPGRREHPTQLPALLPMIETLLSHGATCYSHWDSEGLLGKVFQSGADMTAKECLEAVGRLTSAAARARTYRPTASILYGPFTFSSACGCRFREEEAVPGGRQGEGEKAAADEGQTNPAIAILEKVLEGTGREVLEGQEGSRALERAVESQNREVVYWLVRQGVQDCRRPFQDDRTLCSAHWDVDVMSLLVSEAGADVDDGLPLVSFVRREHYTAAHHLVHLGASVDRALTHRGTRAKDRHRILSVYHSYLTRSVPTHAMRFINTSLAPLRTLSGVSACHRVFGLGVLCCQIAAYLDPLAPLPFSDRTPLGRRLNAALRHFLKRACNLAGHSVRRRLFRHTAFVTPHLTHASASEEGGGAGCGQILDEGVVYGVRDVLHVIRCEEAHHYGLPRMVRGFGNRKAFACAFDGNVVGGGVGGRQCVVERIEGWEGMGERGPPGAMWANGQDKTIDEDVMDEDAMSGMEDMADEDNSLGIGRGDDTGARAAAARRGRPHEELMPSDD